MLTIVLPCLCPQASLPCIPLLASPPPPLPSHSRDEQHDPTTAGSVGPITSGSSGVTTSGSLGPITSGPSTPGSSTSGSTDHSEASSLQHEQPPLDDATPQVRHVW